MKWSYKPRSPLHWLVQSDIILILQESLGIKETVRDASDIQMFKGNSGCRADVKEKSNDWILIGYHIVYLRPSRKQTVNHRCFMQHEKISGTFYRRWEKKHCESTEQLGNKQCLLTAISLFLLHKGFWLWSVCLFSRWSLALMHIST